MTCVEQNTFIDDIGNAFLPLLRAYNILIGGLNITFNATLIWALRRTGQTKTISFQFIAIMSFSDLAMGINSILFITLVTFEQYNEYCWLKLAIQFVLNILNCFSILMIFLIALDRYLHMKYLEQYSLKFTKKRGYLMVIASFAAALFTSTVFILPLAQFTFGIIQTVFVLVAAVFLISVIILYHKALRILKGKAHQVTGSIINQNKALGKAAKRVSICLLILTVPILLCRIIDGVNKQVAYVDSSVLGFWCLTAYITFLANGFCSSIIFISQNVKIQRLLRRVAMGYWNSFRSEVGTMKQ